MEKSGRTEIGLRVPPVTRARSATARTKNAFIHPIQLSPIALALRNLLPGCWRWGFPLQPRLDRLILVIKVGHVHHQILNHKHMGQRRDSTGSGPYINLSQASQPITAVDIHSTGPTDPFPARPPEGEGRVDLVLDLNKSVQHHGPTLFEVDLVVFELRLLRVARVPAVDLESLEIATGLGLGLRLLSLSLRCMGTGNHEPRRRSVQLSPG